MESIARQGSPSGVKNQRRRRAWILILVVLGLAVAAVAADVVATLPKSFARINKFTNTLHTEFQYSQPSEQEARKELAEHLNIHIPDNWHMIRMQSTCQTGEQLNSCSLEGAFAGPAAEFDRYPSLFLPSPVQIFDQPPAYPITCDGLAAKSALGMADQIDCVSQQRLALSGDMGNKVLIAGSATATTVVVSVVL